MRLEDIALKEQFLNRVGSYCTNIKSVYLKEYLNRQLESGCEKELRQLYNHFYTPNELLNYMSTYSTFLGMTNPCLQIHSFLSDHLHLISNRKLSDYFTAECGSGNLILMVEGMVYEIPESEVVSISKELIKTESDSYTIHCQEIKKLVEYIHGKVE